MGNDVDVLVRLQAPDKPKNGHPRRLPLNLALVLDRSGSMSGRPLSEAKRCVLYFLEHLNNDDRVAVVVYDSEVQVLAPCESLGSQTDRLKLKQLLKGVESGGKTNLHGGWLKGAQQVARYAENNAFCRVLLLSDGQANEGLTDPEEIFSQCAELAKAGVTTSTCGLGRHFNEDLMIGMARSGLGNAYYGETLEDLMDPFHEEFALMDNLWMRNIRVQLETAPGVTYSVMNAYPKDSDGSYRLPDLAYESEAWALLRLKVPADLTVNQQEVPLVKVAVAFADRDGVEGTVDSQWLQMKTLDHEEWGKTAENDLVVRRAVELRAADLQDAAHRAARRGQWEKIGSILEEFEVLAGEHEWLEEIGKELKKLAKTMDRERFAKESRYQSDYMRKRLAAKNESRLASQEAELPYARRKSRRGKAETSKNSRDTQS